MGQYLCSLSNELATGHSREEALESTALRYTESWGYYKVMDLRSELSVLTREVRDDADFRVTYIETQAVSI
ncbi:hypothetical protein MK139_16155 [bacterium]|nr:hypothetical protein [bacterium]